MKRRILSLAMVLALVAVMVMPVPVLAATVTVTDTVSPSTKALPANHLIGWTQSTAWIANQAIVVTFASGFTLSPVALADIDLYIGAEKTLVTTPASGSITCAVATNTVTFTPYTAELLSASAAPVVIEIGTNAAGGVNQITNPTAAASYAVSVVSGSDSGTANVAITTSFDTAITGVLPDSIAITTPMGTFAMPSLDPSASQPITSDAKSIEVSANGAKTWNLGAFGSDSGKMESVGTPAHQIAAAMVISCTAGEVTLSGISQNIVAAHVAGTATISTVIFKQTVAYTDTVHADYAITVTFTVGLNA